MTDDLLTKLLWMTAILLISVLSWHCGRRYEVAIRRQRRKDRRFSDKGT